MAEARDRRDRGQALLRAPRRRRPRHPARRLGRRHRPAAPSRAARRSRSSSSRTRSTATRRTITRKLKEAALAWQLEQDWTKDGILTAYLNTIYFGNGAYGVEQACRVYFGHSADADVDPAEAALLAGHPREPEPLRPGRPPDAPRSSAGTSCCGRCTCSTTSTTTSTGTGSRRRCRTRSRSGCRRRRDTTAPYFANYVTDQLRVEVPRARQVYGGGLKVQDDDRPRAAEDRARGDREGAPALDRPDGGARRDRRPHRRRARDDRRAQLPRRASSTSRRRASGSRARRSSRSCSRRRSRAGSRRRRRSSRTRS